MGGWWGCGRKTEGRLEVQWSAETAWWAAPLCMPLTPRPAPQVKMAYVNFVNHCYVDTEVEMKEIYTSNHIWTLFENFTLDMARVRPHGGWWPAASQGWPWSGPCAG